MSNLEFWSKLSSEQKELASVIYQKWLITAQSTERINYQKAMESIRAAYLAIAPKAHIPSRL